MLARSKFRVVGPGVDSHPEGRDAKWGIGTGGHHDIRETEGTRGERPVGAWPRNRLGGTESCTGDGLAARSCGSPAGLAATTPRAALDRWLGRARIEGHRPHSRGCMEGTPRRLVPHVDHPVLPEGNVESGHSPWGSSAATSFLGGGTHYALGLCVPALRATTPVSFSKAWITALQFKSDRPIAAARAQVWCTLSARNPGSPSS